MTDAIIKVEGLGKRYLLGQQREGAPYRTLREGLVDAIRTPFRRRPATGGEPMVDFWALRDVNFEVRRGEVVGIIGRNGAGKSTLLKILSRITEPTTGRIRIGGRVASLLEVGTGFHPELTGRENIFLNGAILGMHRSEIKAKFDEIVAFAEVEKFLDTPVKRYSSGMYVRLAFAVAAHLEPEILIVDEVLAVGDAQFQKKCLGKMEDVSKHGRTVLFVSHNMGAVTQMCSRGILLDGGRVKKITSAKEAASLYLRLSVEANSATNQAFNGPLADSLDFQTVELDRGSQSELGVVQPSSPVKITVKGVARRAIPSFRLTLSLYRESVRLLTMHDVHTPMMLDPGTFEAHYEIPAYFLRPGEYSVAIGGYRDGMDEWVWGTDLILFTVSEEWSEGYDPINIGWVNLVHYGNRTTSGA